MQAFIDQINQLRDDGVEISPETNSITNGLWHPLSHNLIKWYQDIDGILNNTKKPWSPENITSWHIFDSFDGGEEYSWRISSEYTETKITNFFYNNSDRRGETEWSRNLYEARFRWYENNLNGDIFQHHLLDVHIPIGFTKMVVDYLRDHEIKHEYIIYYIYDEWRKIMEYSSSLSLREREYKRIGSNGYKIIFGDLVPFGNFQLYGVQNTNDFNKWVNSYKIHYYDRIGKTFTEEEKETFSGCNAVPREMMERVGLC